MEQIERAGCKHHSDHIQEVVGREQPALFFPFGMFLQKGVQRNDEKSAGQARHSKPEQAGSESMREAQQHGGQAQQRGAIRNQADLHRVARKPSGGDAASSDPHRQRRHQKAGTCVGQVQRFSAEQNNRHLKESAQEPEIRNARHGEPQRTVAINALYAGPDFAERIPLHRQARAGSGHFADEQTGQRSNDGDSEQHPAHNERLVFPARKQERSHAGSQYDGGESGKLHQSVGARQLRFAEHFGKDAVFSWAEEVGLHREQEQNDQQHVDAAHRKSDDADQHNHDFEGLGDLQHARFAETVGQLPGVTRE